MTNLKGRAG